MTKFTAILNFVFGIAFALVGLFALARAIAFLSAAPSGHEGLIAWAVMIIFVGVCLVIGGLRHVRFGASRLQGPDVPEDY
jgi:hypothetical protein